MLSFSQELLLFGELLSGNAPTISRLVKIHGPLDLNRFTDAAAATIGAHEPLRSTWEWEQDQPIWIVRDHSDIPNSMVLTENPPEWSYQHIHKTVAAGISSFSSQVPPHMRHGLVRISEEEHIWGFGVHHLVADAISLRAYGQTFSSAYAGHPCLDQQPSSSIEYSKIQRQWLETPAAQAHFEWWIEKIKPLGKQRIPIKSGGGTDSTIERQEIRLPIPKTTVSFFARKLRVPVSAMMLGALANTTGGRGETHLSVLTNVPCRSLPGASTATGAFYNSVPITLEIDGDPLTTVERAAEALFEALDHQEVPVALISVGGAKLGSPHLADRIPISFNLVEHPLTSFSLPGCWLEDVTVRDFSPCEWGLTSAHRISNFSNSKEFLNCVVSPLEHSLVLSVEYSPGHSDSDDITLFLSEFAKACERLMAGAALETSKKPGLVADFRL